jgi:hypothetical protein
MNHEYWFKMAILSGHRWKNDRQPQRIQSLQLWWLFGHFCVLENSWLWKVLNMGRPLISQLIECMVCALTWIVCVSALVKMSHTGRFSKFTTHRPPCRLRNKLPAPRPGGSRVSGRGLPAIWHNCAHTFLERGDEIVALHRRDLWAHTRIYRINHWADKQIT